MRWPWQPRIEKKAVLGTTDELGAFLIYGTTGAETPSAALNLYEKSTAVSIPINMIVDSFAIMEPILVIDNKRVEHEVIELLRKPSPYYSRIHLLEILGKDFLITGECSMIGLGGVDRPPLELQPISPKMITVVEGSGGIVHHFGISGNTLPGIYEPQRKGREVRYYDPHNAFREFKQIRSYSTKSNSLLRGQSRLVAAAKEARQHILGTEHNVSLLEKGGRVSLVFHFDTDMDDDDFEEAKKRVRSQFGGATQAGEIGVTAGGKLQIEEMGVTNKDMDYANLQAIASKSCALQYRVPLPLITNERQTMNNYREGKLALYDDAVIPLAHRIFDGLGDFLLPRFKLDPARARLTYDPDEISALVSRRNDELKKRAGIGVESDNELRAFLQREPYEGGDIIYKPSTMIPVGSDIFTEDNAPEEMEEESS